MSVQSEQELAYNPAPSLQAQPGLQFRPARNERRYQRDPTRQLAGYGERSQYGLEPLGERPVCADRVQAVHYRQDEDQCCGSDVNRLKLGEVPHDSSPEPNVQLIPK